MRFELPLLLALAPAVTLLVGLVARWAERRRLALARAWSPALAATAARAGWLSLPLLALAAVGAAIGAAGPRGGRRAQIAESRGLNVLIAVDISRSMLAEDTEPNRLRRSVREARRLLQDVARDRVGVIAFAGQSYILSPLTLDHSAADMYLEALDPDLASTGGTNLSAVLIQARQALAASLEGGDRALVIFSDGEAHDSLSDALAAARELAADGVRLVLVAEGGDRPVRIPLRDVTGAVTDYKRDDLGRIVQTARMDEVLEALARAADGTLIRADVPDQAGAVRDLLRGLARRPLRERRLADLQPLAWLAGLAAALLLLGQTAARRTMALVGLGLFLLPSLSAPVRVGPPLSAQSVSPADRHLQAGRLNEAYTAFRDAALRGEGGDTAWYNAGTAALAAERMAEAIDALSRAARTVDPALRFRALYNLGLANLLSARRDPAARQQREEEAVAALKQALLLDPMSPTAKWNLELLVRDRPPASGGAPPPPSGGEERPEPEPQGLSAAEAEALLSSVERDELATRAEANRRQRLQGSVARKDW